MMSFNNCVSPFKWLLVDDQFGLPSYVDGILGLTQGRNPQGSEQLPEDYSVGPLWLDFVFKSGYITEESFSTAFSGFQDRSFIDFGPPNNNSMIKSLYAEINVDRGFFYSAVPEAIRFGDISKEKAFTLPETSPAIFSSSMSVSMVPSSVSSEFFSYLMSGIKHVEDNGVFYIDCTIELPDVHFMFSNRWI